ncbi:hypothetical protein F4805DRAFT_456564 [Annulohypoxylon moriforme]|nr:hypothetical protein F4805DRAFT_456564 [Annulohypoxylon moriforme]
MREKQDVKDVTKIYLASENINHNMEDHLGQTILFRALTDRINLDIDKILLASERVNPDSDLYLSISPLGFAARKGRKDLAKLLPENGANPDKIDGWDMAHPNERVVPAD